jgi:hypothetical protein
LTLSSASAKTIYHDGLFARACIWLLTRKMALAVGQGSLRSGYDGFVEVSTRIMSGRTAPEQRAMVSQVLASLVPAPVLWLIRTAFSPTRWVCESNAWFATVMFEWLVGPCEVKAVEVPTADGVRQQNSGVQIKKCRYLEASGCVGLCVNLCKVPTQDFFTQKFGIPLTMTPNFEDMSCEMVFGQPPPPLETEDAYRQPCLVQDCDTAIAARPCPKTRQGDNLS